MSVLGYDARKVTYRPARSKSFMSLPVFRVLFLFKALAACPSSDAIVVQVPRGLSAIPEC
jgi:hypothetical protein